MEMQSCKLARVPHVNRHLRPGVATYPAIFQYTCVHNSVGALWCRVEALGRMKRSTLLVDLLVLALRMILFQRSRYAWRAKLVLQNFFFFGVYLGVSLEDFVTVSCGCAHVGQDC